MRSKAEIRKMLDVLEREYITEGPFTEKKNIARMAAKQALEWVLGEADNPLTYRVNA
jgi:hypothetical protein